MNVRPHQAALLFLLPAPGAAASIFLPGSCAGRLIWRVALALPLIALPSLLALTRLQRHQGRAAFGLGAGRLDQLRWLWLPQLGPGLAASLLLLLLFTLADRLRG